MPSNTGVVIVVGASSGIGAALASHLAHEARRVVLLARRVDQLERVRDEINRKVGTTRAFVYRHDVTDRTGVDELFDRIEREVGEVDELHYVAGIMPDVRSDEFPTDKDARMFDVNTLGCIAWCNAAAVRFLDRRRGHIVGVTSVAGDRGRVDRPGYNASKAAQDSFLESLRNRLWRHGVYVTTVRPGPVITPMTEGLDVPMPIPVERAARAIARARDRRRAIVYVPFRWRVIMAVIKSIPSFVFRRMNI